MALPHHLIPAPRVEGETSVENPGLLIVDKDNLDGHLGLLERIISLDEIVRRVPDLTGIDLLVNTCVFRTIVRGYQSVYQATMDDPSLYCLEVGHAFAAGYQQPGYPDDDMYRNAWKLVDHYQTLVIVTSDGGADEFAQELRRGYNRFTNEQDETLGREVVLVGSAAWGRSQDWTDNWVDLDELLSIIPDRVESGISMSEPA